MRNSLYKFRQSSIVFEKPGLLSEKLKILMSSNSHRVHYFWLKLRTRFLLTTIYKKVVGSFLFCLDLDFFVKIKKSGFYPFDFYIFIKNSRSKQDKENFEQAFVDIVKQKTCAKFQQKILNFVVVGDRQSFQFFRQIAWFLGASSKFRYRILYN